MSLASGLVRSTPSEAAGLDETTAVSGGLLAGVVAGLGVAATGGVVVLAGGTADVAGGVLGVTSGVTAGVCSGGDVDGVTYEGDEDVAFFASCVDLSSLLFVAHIARPAPPATSTQAPTAKPMNNPLDDLPAEVLAAAFFGKTTVRDELALPFFSVEADGTTTRSPQSGHSSLVPAFSSAVLRLVSHLGQENRIMTIPHNGDQKVNSR
jgi:hypothetical protein